jgi:hypothetical protein
MARRVGGAARSPPAVARGRLKRDPPAVDKTPRAVEKRGCSLPFYLPELEAGLSTRLNRCLGF